MTTVQFKNWKCTMEVSRYMNNERTSIVLFSGGERIAVATVNIPDEPLEDNEIIIKSFSENQGMYEAMLEAKIITPFKRMVKAGYCEAYVCGLMYTITKEKYESKHPDYRGVWSSDHIHQTNYDGKRTILTNINGTCLLIEDVGFRIVDSEIDNINPVP